MNYLNYNDVLYSYINFEIWGKILNEIKYEKYKEKFYPFLKMIIMRIIELNVGNINQIIYYLFKNNNEEEYITIILKGIISHIKNKSNIELDREIFTNLSLYKGKTIETKFMNIQIFQLLYLNYNKDIIKIFQKNKLNNETFYKILNNFFECNIITKIQNNNEEISKDKMYLKEIIKNYLLFSIHYFYDYYNFDFEIPNNLNFEKYIEIINNNLDDLISQITEGNIKLYMNEKIDNLIFNILLYSKLYIENKDDNLRNNLFKIYESTKNFLIIKLTYEIESNLNYKQNNRDINNNSIFPTFKL